jgi:AcrR family transcriptional regulator
MGDHMNNLIHRKEKIIFTAIEVINELGIQALSTKKIAQKQEIAESTIFKHFENKSALLLAVLDFYSQYDDDICSSVRLKDLKGINALEYYLDSYINYYENYPAITAITQGLDELRYIDDLSERARQIVVKRYECVKMIIKDAQEKGDISNKYDSQILTDIFMGTINGIIRRWRLENYQFDLAMRCREAMNLVFGCGFIEERGE